MKAPMIMDQDQAKLIRKLKEMVPYFAPEWRFDPDNPDAGSALFLMFLELLEGNIERLNELPMKHFTVFLNQFGMQLHTATSASTFVTFTLSEGARSNLYIPKGTVVTDINQQLFETEGAFVPTPASISKIFNVSASVDRIAEVPEAVYHPDKRDQTFSMDGYPMFSVEGDNLQDHILYIGHDDQLNVKHGAVIELELMHSKKRFEETGQTAMLSRPGFLEWSFFNGTEWILFDRIANDGRVLKLYKDRYEVIPMVELHEKTSRWIRCRIPSISREETGETFSLIEFDDMRLQANYQEFIDQKYEGIVPDFFFDDQMELEEERDGGIYPFGKEFMPMSSFYIASEEALTKRESYIRLNFTLRFEEHEVKLDQDPDIEWKWVMKEKDLRAIKPQHIRIHEVIWEYWNGNGWVNLPIDPSYNQLFKQPFEGEEAQQIGFYVPGDLDMSSVNAENNHWLRIRIVDMDRIRYNELIYYTPQLSKVNFTYHYDRERFQIEECLTYNNLEYLDRIDHIHYDEGSFNPFYYVDTPAPMMYVGWNQKLERGPIHLFLSISRRAVPQEEIPAVVWEYLGYENNQEVWQELPAMDQTLAFTQSGIVAFMVPKNAVRSRQFGEDLFWIRAVNTDRRYDPGKAGKEYPDVLAVIPNTVTVIQQQSIRGETPVKVETYEETYFQVVNRPMIEEVVQVDETGLISEQEIARLGDQVEVDRDTGGEILSCWVTWNEVPHFFHSDIRDRHYRIDRAQGRVYFGDGRYGKEPPNGDENRIRIKYQHGGGSKGNIEAGDITGLEQAFPFVDEVSNHLPAGGGSDVEKLSEVMIRGPETIKNRNRAVTAEDTEWYLHGQASYIDKIKCLPNTNELLEGASGHVTVVMMPDSHQVDDDRFPRLKRQIVKALMTQVPAAIAFEERMNVIMPAILNVAVSVRLTIDDMEEIIPIENEGRRLLGEFLDPKSGHFSGAGWRIGESVHPSMFMALFQQITAVRQIDHLYVTIWKMEYGKYEEISMEEASRLKHGLVMSGNHDVHVRVEKGGN